MENCIFCRIIRKEIPTEIVQESVHLVVFPDVNPAATVHLLIVPKNHIASIRDLQEKHLPVLWEIFKMVNQLVKEHNLIDGLYRVVVNGGKAQHIPHLHFHLLGGQWNNKA